MGCCQSSDDDVLRTVSDLDDLLQEYESLFETEYQAGDTPKSPPLNPIVETTEGLKENQKI